jgi:hypothetical protein
MRRRGLWIPTVLLAALPLSAQPLPEQPLPLQFLAAQSSPKNLCGPPSQSSTLAGVAEAGTYQPLPSEQRLFHRLSGFEQESLEVRYLVDGDVFLTERVDLASAELPRVLAGSTKRSAGPQPPLAWEPAEPSGPLEEGRMIELLALRPDMVRQLYRLAQGGARIELEVLQQGALVETLAFDELLRRSADLRESRVAAVAVQSTVAGPGDRGQPVQRVFAASTYLEDCAECTTSTPCETECGWDPWKGGPVTCGEYGVCEPGTCDCEWIASESWGSWYPIRSFRSGWYDCFLAYGGGSRWHEEWVTEYRRDLIRRTYICPNCPSCSGCYIEEEVIAYQLGYSYCWLDVGPSCFNGWCPSCGSLCYWSPGTPCGIC